MAYDSAGAVKLYAIHWRSIANPEAKGAGTAPMHEADAFRMCRELNEEYKNAIWHYPQEIPSAETVPNRLAGQRQKDS